KAREYYFKALKIAEETGANIIIASTLSNIGNIYQEENNYKVALGYYFKALKLAEEVGLKKDMAMCMGNIGLVYLRTKRCPEAEKYLLNAINIDSVTGDIVHRSIVHLYLSDAYSQTSRFADAL